MPTMDSPLNSAHQHAANADDYMAQGLLIPAAEENYKAATAFEAAYNAASDEHTKRTLQMLYTEHTKAGKELQRRIEKLKADNKDPSLPQKPFKLAHNPSGASNTQRAPQPLPSPPPQISSGRLSDSQHTVDESFMLLGQRSEPGDAFNHFWKITEGMLEHLSQPVAFATAPLAPPENGSSSSRFPDYSGHDYDVEDPITKTLNRGFGLMKSAKSRILNTTPDSGNSRAGITTFPPKPQPIDDDWDDDLDDDDHMADSFCVIPSKTEPPTSALKKENAILRAQVEAQQAKLAAAERMLKQRQEQDQHLRDSIMLARKEAQRAMTSSIAMRPPQSPLPGPAATPPAPPSLPGELAQATPVASPAQKSRTDRDAQYVRRIRELEDDVRHLRAENEKQKAMIVKFRERWEKLKESAKKKKEAKAAAETTSVINDRIEEDPEAEAEAERQTELLDG